MGNPARTSKLFHYLLLLFGCTGFVDASNLSLSHHLNIVPTCGALSECEKVLTSQYSEVLGWPVADFGSAAFFSILLCAMALAVLQGRIRSFVLRLLLGLCGCGTVISISLQVLSLFVLHAVCVYCLISAASVIVCFGVALFLYRQEPKLQLNLGREWLWTAWVLSIVALFTLRRWDELRSASVDIPLNSRALATTPADRLLPANPIVNQAASGRHRTYVAFYDPTCGGCASSFRHAVVLLATDKYSRLVVRLVSHGSKGSVASVIGAELEGLGGSRAYAILADWYTKNHDNTLDAFRSLLKSEGFGDSLTQNSPLIKAGALRIEANTKEFDDLHAMGTPVMVLVDPSGSREVVNPLTLKPIG